jgi:hypothetical protein
MILCAAVCSRSHSRVFIDRRLCAHRQFNSNRTSAHRATSLRTQAAGMTVVTALVRGVLSASSAGTTQVCIRLAAALNVTIALTALHRSKRCRPQAHLCAQPRSIATTLNQAHASALMVRTDSCQQV